MKYIKKIAGAMKMLLLMIFVTFCTFSFSPREVNADSTVSIVGETKKM